MLSQPYFDYINYTVIMSFRFEMEGDDGSFPPDSSDEHSQRGSVASSATLSRRTVQQILEQTCCG